MGVQQVIPSSSTTGWFGFNIPRVLFELNIVAGAAGQLSAIYLHWQAWNSCTLTGNHFPCAYQPQ